jgi:SagB-type dehydrogenase family enzyme
MKLQQPQFDGEISLERAIKNRRTSRAFMSDPLSQGEFSQLLWAAYGITDDRGFKRTAPSGGALYPMDLYAVAGTGGVKDLETGTYHYDPNEHSISSILEGDIRVDLARASLSQMWMATAPVNLIITVEYRRISVKYGERGARYALMEAGHIGQNIFLQAEALGLGAGIVGAFHDENVSNVVKIPRENEPLLIMPVGHKS